MAEPFPSDTEGRARVSGRIAFAPENFFWLLRVSRLAPVRLEQAIELASNLGDCGHLSRS